MAEKFLTEAWFAEVDKIREEVGDPEPNPATKDLVFNITVTGTPDGDKDLHNKGGEFGDGHIDDAPTKLTLPYDVAKAIIVDGNQAMAMQAFMGGQIKVEGDMTKVMALQTAQPTADQIEFQKRLRDITE